MFKNGFSPVLIIIIAAVFFVGSGFFVWQYGIKKAEPDLETIKTEEPESQPEQGANSEQGFFEASPQESAALSQEGVKCPDGTCDDFDGSKISGQVPQGGGQLTSPTALQEQKQKISVKAINSSYKTASTKPTGFFKTGQAADIMLAGIDFNNAGSPLLFNHPGNLATDGTRLILADRNNNRMLVWNKLPLGNTAPDLVLGQQNFTANNPGAGLDGLNWPVGVSMGGGKLAVADTYNDRVLVWNSFPVNNGQSADFEITEDVGWPWAVWTNGEKLVITSTSKASILIWNSFPDKNRKADIIISLPEKLGTPRSIASDGKHLVIGDHNAFRQKQGTFFWKTFPVQNNQIYDFFVAEVPFMGAQQAGGNMLGSLLWGPTMTEDGRLIGVANQLYIWNSFPENEKDAPDLSVGSGSPGDRGYDFGGSQSGDGSGVAVAGNKLYVSLSNGNKIVGFNALPIKKEQNPDFAVGASDINTNTLRTNYFSTNPISATDGKSLFVASSFDKTLYIWKALPAESGAKPDFVYDLDFAPNDIAVSNNYLILGGNNKLIIWKKIPLNGEMPDIIFDGKMADFEIKDVQGIALDDKYFYLADRQANKIHLWEGVPENGGYPKFSFGEAAPKLSSDGEYLAAVDRIYKISDLSSISLGNEIPGRRFNLPGDGILYNNKYFVADTVSNRVQIWNLVEDAISGKNPDIILGQNNFESVRPAIGKNRLFWPGTLYFDGSFLWVGEYKFSGRVVRFSVSP